MKKPCQRSRRLITDNNPCRPYTGLHVTMIFAQPRVPCRVLEETLTLSAGEADAGNLLIQVDNSDCQGILTEY